MSNVKAMTYVQSIPLKGDGEGRRTPSTLGSRLDGPSGTGRREGLIPNPIIWWFGECAVDRSTQGLSAAGQGNFMLNNNTTSGSKEDVVSRPTAPNTSFSRCPRPVVSTPKPRGSPAASALCSWGEQLSPAQPPPGTAPALHQGHPSQALAPAGRLKSHLLGPHPGLLSQDPRVSGIWLLPQSGTTKQALVALSG